ncbi:MAG TPA: helix-turn-helix domain-containing protein [Candidatus Acidoferrum sp.]|nr:helix-turn-helix domain-containing protein [Candidatus Acidoferrum sp.]
MAPGSPLDKAQSQPRTRGEARRALLRERGVSLSDIARDLGKNLSVVSRVNSGQRRSREIEAAIAQSLGLSVREAFPEWYGDPPRPGEH